MSNGAKLIFRFLMWVAVILYIAVAVWYQSSTDSSVKLCSGLVIKIKDDQKFVDEGIVSSLLDSIMTSCKGKSVDELPLYDMEKIISDNPYVQDVDVSTDIDGHCIVELSQRDVIFRLVSDKGHDFFVDTLGYRLNPNGVWQKNVPVVTTDMDLPFAADEYGDENDSKYYLKNLHNFVRILGNDNFLTNLVTQIKLTGDAKPGHEMVHLIPRIGHQRIVLGNLDELESKLKNVGTFYRNTFHDGWWRDANEVCFQYGDKIIIKRR